MKAIKMTVATVNVIEMIDGMLSGITEVNSFTDNDEGNKEAKKLFKSRIKKYVKKSDIKSHVKDGYFEHDEINYAIYLVHSV